MWKGWIILDGVEFFNYVEKLNWNPIKQHMQSRLRANGLETLK